MSWAWLRVIAGNGSSPASGKTRSGGPVEESDEGGRAAAGGAAGEAAMATAGDDAARAGAGASAGAGDTSALSAGPATAAGAPLARLLLRRERPRKRPFRRNRMPTLNEKNIT